MKKFAFGILVILIITLARYITIAGTAFVVFYQWLERRLVKSKYRCGGQRERQHTGKYIKNPVWVDFNVNSSVVHRDLNNSFI